MQRTIVLNIAGFSHRLLKSAPNLNTLAQRGTIRPLKPVFPALTCPVQATFLTGRLPQHHGCVANGWYSRELAEPLFWKQNNGLIEGDKLWHTARQRDPSFTCAQLFWWFNMYAQVDWSATPRPIYTADGRKIPDFYTQPAELHQELLERFGPFPLHRFWGPAAGLASSRWITDCALHIYRTRQPTLTLIYLPHLDYSLQQLGPNDPAITAEVAAVDTLCGELIACAEADGAHLIVLSEYGITAVSGDVPINRALRQAGWLAVRNERGEEKLDPGASKAFALVDHQIAHVYVQRSELMNEVKALLLRLDGIETVLDEEGKRSMKLNHPRAGELVAISRPERWFSYYYWLDDACAPDFARTVDIHRKPGYDPAELFIDPQLIWPRLQIGWTLFKRRLGMRSLLNVVPLTPSLVKGSHGRLTDDIDQGPVLISSYADKRLPPIVKSTCVHDIILNHIGID